MRGHRAKNDRDEYQIAHTKRRREARCSRHRKSNGHKRECSLAPDNGMGRPELRHDRRNIGAATTTHAGNKCPGCSIRRPIEVPMAQAAATKEALMATDAVIPATAPAKAAMRVTLAAAIAVSRHLKDG